MEKHIKCPQSGEYFKPKRSNQKYASKHNRIAFHNKQYRESRLPLERVNQKLYKNFNIISGLMGNDNEIILSNDYLKGKEYDLKYMTQIYIKDDKTYFGLYDLAFTKVNESTIKFLKNESC